MSEDYVCKCGRRFVWLEDFIIHSGECASGIKESAPSASTNSQSDAITLLNEMISAFGNNSEDAWFRANYNRILAVVA